MAWTLKNRDDLELTICHLSKMYARRDSSRTEPLWSAARRREEVENEIFAIRTLERQIAEFFHAEPLDDSNYPEIADSLRAMEEFQRNREAVENLPATPPKL